MGTIQAWGFQGEIDAIQWAKSAPNYGANHGVLGVNDWKGAALAGTVRTIRLQGGTGFAHGVQVELSGTQDVTSTAVPAGSSRWDTICARYTWTGGGSAQFVAVPGTATMALAGGLNANPGVVFDQPLMLAQYTAGNDTATSVVDLRRWASKEITATSLLALEDLPFGATATVQGVTYTRVLEGGSLAWSTGTPWTNITLASGWLNWQGGEPGRATQVNPPQQKVRYSKRDGIVFIEGAASFVGNAVEGTTLFTLPPGFRPEIRQVHSVGWGARQSALMIYEDGRVELFRKGTDTTFYIVPLNLSFVAAV